MSIKKFAFAFITVTLSTVTLSHAEHEKSNNCILDETDQSVICSVFSQFKQVEQKSLFGSLTKLFFYSSEKIPSNLNPEELDTEESAFLVLINQYRNQNGLPSLMEDPSISSISQWMSQDMAHNNYVSRTDSMGRDPYQRMVSIGYYPKVWRENIAAGRANAKGVFTAWQNSPSNNANMLYPGFHSIGIGRAYSSDSTYKWYWTTDFGDQ